MTLIVNGEKIDITLEDEKTVGDVLKSFELEAEKNDAATLKIILDGKEITSDTFDSILDTPLKEDTCIELTVITKQDVLQSFAASQNNFNSLSSSLCEVPVLLQSGKDKEANSIISSLAREIDTFCHASALSALFPDIYSKLLIDGTDVASFFTEFSPILSDLEEALKNKDTVTVGDLSEYEIGPRLANLSKAIQNII